MITRDDLVSYLHELLACNDFEDYAPNGLQIEGSKHIYKICTAVTASLDAVEQAVALEADALLVHHGYFWRGETPVITGMKRQRIARLIENNVSLLAYHLPLDCHAELGNNACLARLLSFHSIKKHKLGRNRDLLWTGSLTKATTGKKFLSQLEEKFAREPLHLQGSEKPIYRVAWCSGAAQDYIEEAHNLGVDAYISGEVSERTYYQAKELGLHYFACGHHATERYGIQALGSHLAAKFDLAYHFIDSSNPI